MSIAASNVTFIKTWTTGGLTGKRQRVRQVRLNDASGGDDTNTITAAVLKLTAIEEATPLIYGTAAYMAVPATDGSKLYLYDPTSPTAPGAVTFGAGATYGGYVLVKGY